jgi:DNA-binding transcriptional ArsR family regulator
MDDARFSKSFKAFGDPSRLKILRLLAKAEMTVGDVADKVSLAQPTVSRHLSLLREAGIVTSRRNGQQVFYSLNKKSIEECCSGFCCCLRIDDKPKKTRKSKK